LEEGHTQKMGLRIKRVIKKKKKGIIPKILINVKGFAQ